MREQYGWLLSNLPVNEALWVTSLLHNDCTQCSTCPGKPSDLCCQGDRAMYGEPCKSLVASF